MNNLVFQSILAGSHLTSSIFSGLLSTLHRGSFNRIVRQAHPSSAKEGSPLAGLPFAFIYEVPNPREISALAVFVEFFDVSPPPSHVLFRRLCDTVAHGFVAFLCLLLDFIHQASTGTTQVALLC